MNNLEKLTDQELFSRCEQYGGNARLWMRKFAGLIPEVARRKLHEKKGFQSIFEFAAKLGGMSKEQVQRILNLDIKFEDRLTLRAMLETGEASVHKLARVASVVTPDSEEYWANQIRCLPKSALETLVRDSRREAQPESVPGHGSKEKYLPRERCSRQGHEESTADDELELSAEVKKKLIELQNKGIDVNALLTEFLEQREAKIEAEKSEIAAGLGTAKSRYISARIKKLLIQEYGKKCSIPTCNKLAIVIHHMQRFAMSRNHDPRYLAPLCKDHHTIAHNIDRKFIARAAPHLQSEVPSYIASNLTYGRASHSTDAPDKSRLIERRNLPNFDNAIAGKSVLTIFDNQYIWPIHSR